MAPVVAILDIEQNNFNLAILNISVTVMLPTKFWLNPTWVWEKMSFEEFQDGFHGAILDIGMILAILNLCVTVMPPIKFQFNLTYCLGGDIV